MQGYFSKQMIFLVCTMGFFTVRSFVDPFWGVLMYYGLAVLRPQAIWDWALPEFRWSLLAALVAIVTTILNASSVKKVNQFRFLTLTILFGGCLFLSYCLANDQVIAGRYGWEYAKILLMVIVASYVVREKWHIRYLGWMIFLCLTYLVYEVNLQYLIDRRLDIYNRGYGGLDNNGAALMLAMVAPFCYYYFFAGRRWWRWGFLFCLISTFHAVMLTQSRGAMLSTLVVMLGILVTTARKKFLKTMVIGVVLGFAVLYLAGPDIRMRFLSITGPERDASSQSRLDSWKAGWRIAWDYPWFGAGIRNANLLAQQYGADMKGRTIHNVYIQIAADVGFPAAVIYVSLLGFAFWRLGKAIRMTRGSLEDMEDRWFHYTCRASIWSLGIFSIGALFLSLETFELCYLIILIGAVAPSLASQGNEERQELDVEAAERKRVKISTEGLST